MNKKYDEKGNFKLTPEEIEKIKLVPFLEWMRNKKSRMIKWWILYIFLFAILLTQVKLIYITSESVPYSCCLQLYNVEPEIGDLCVLDFHSPDSDKVTTLVKYVAGKAGDQIHVRDRKVFVNGRFVGEAKANNLTPIDDMTIPNGFVFVMGTHENSFDSRYKEFGLIKEKDLHGKAIGFIVRS